VGGALRGGGGGRGEAPVFRQPQNRPQHNTSTLTPVVRRVPEPDTGGSNPACGGDPDTGGELHKTVVIGSIITSGWLATLDLFQAVVGWQIQIFSSGWL
jgi:hypothetical protein